MWREKGEKLRVFRSFNYKGVLNVYHGFCPSLSPAALYNMACS
jgi:hypothetical protein